MNRLKNTRSSLFLIELIFAILFFSLGSALCVQVFVKSYLVSKSARDLSFASSQASSAASVLKYSEQTFDSLQEFFPNVEESSEGFVIRYDSDYQFCDSQNSAYQLRIQTEVQGNAENAHIWLTESSGELVYELRLRYPAGQ